MSADALGSIRKLTDQNANETGGYSYDPFGKVTQHTGADSSFGFTGEQFDPESGLTYLRSRYYDPATGNFMGRDTYGGQLTNTQSLNRYSYVENNPVNFVDPSGHELTIAAAMYLIGGAIVGGLAEGAAESAIEDICKEVPVNYNKALISGESKIIFMGALLTGGAAAPAAYLAAAPAAYGGYYYNKAMLREDPDNSEALLSIIPGAGLVKSCFYDRLGSIDHQHFSPTDEAGGTRSDLGQPYLNDRKDLNFPYSQNNS